MSRHVGLVRAQDMLEGGPGLPDSRPNPEEPFPERGRGGPEQLRQRDAPEPAPSGQLEASEAAKRQAAPAATAAAADRRQQREQTRGQEEGRPKGPEQSQGTVVLFPKVPELLREGPAVGHRRDDRPQVQQAQRRWRRLRFSLLRERLQRRQAEMGREVRVQVSLVLLRAVPELHEGGVDHRLQVRR